MLVHHQTIAMKFVDLESLDESEDNHEAIEFDIVLSEVPEAKWVEEFDIAYRIMPNSIKPPVQVIGDRLRVTYLPRYGADLQSFIEFIKAVMQRAAEEVIKTEAIAKHGHTQEHVDAFRDVLRRIQVDA